MITELFTTDKDGDLIVNDKEVEEYYWENRIPPTHSPEALATYFSLWAMEEFDNAELRSEWVPGKYVSSACIALEDLLGHAFIGLEEFDYNLVEEAEQLFIQEFITDIPYWVEKDKEQIV